MNSQMKEVLDTHAELHPLPIENQTPEVARTLPELKDAIMGVLQAHMAKRLIKGVVIPVKEVTHSLIPGKGGDILARIYKPSDEKNLPVLLYFHGGGFVIANLNSYDSSCRALAVGAECIVVSVAYRQAPENQYPAAHEDAMTAYEWILQNAATFGGDPSRIAIGGESAGGNLAASTCLQAIRKGLPLPVHQLLVYPFVDSDMTRPSYVEHANAKPLNKPMMSWFAKHYFGDNIPANDPIAFPMQTEDLSGMPSTTLLTAEIDPLRSEGEVFAQKLREAGVPVFYKCYEGVTHEFFGMGAAINEALVAVKDATDQLQAGFDFLDDIRQRPDLYPTEVRPLT